MAEAVRTVGRDLEVEHDIQVDDVAQRLSRRAPLEHENAGGILAETEFDGRAQHARRLVLAAICAHAQWFGIGGGPRTGRRVRNQIAHAQVRSARHHAQGVRGNPHLDENPWW